MSKVKFIQWGTPEKPKTYQQYTESFEDVKSQYPGGVIFVTYTDDNDKQKQEIWANGVQYSVGGGGGGNVIYGTDMIDATGKTYTWQIDGETGEFVIDENGQRIPEYTNITGSEGSIYVYTGEKTQTAYYWVTTDDGGKWEPFNVDAENIWFDGAVKRNKAWGKMGATQTSVVDFTERKNLVDYLKFYLLESGPVPEPTVNYNENDSPTLTVSSNHSITGLEVTDGTNTYTVGTHWVHAGTKVSLIQNKSVKYSNFGLSTSTRTQSLTQGGISVTGMPFGFWLTENDAEGGKTDTKVKTSDETTIATTYQGNSTTQSFTVADTYEYGACKIQLGVSNLTYTAPTGQNDFAEVTASTSTDEVYLPVTHQRDFRVQDKKDGTITITGTNKNSWSATSAACTIPSVTVYVSNNESDSYEKYTYSKTINSSTQTKSPSNKTATITLKGYYPIYSNIKQSAYTTTVTEVNNDSKYNYSFTTWKTKWASGGKAPVIIEYPSTKTATLTVGGSATQVGGPYTPVTQVNKTIGGNTVTYNQLQINLSFAAGQAITFSLS